MSQQRLDYARFMVFNTTFNNFSIISSRSVLLVEETGVPGQKAIFLINNRASVLILDKNKRSLAHHASYAGMFSLLSKVLQKGCDPNLQVIYY
jgi:hypothetical protein